MIITGKDKSAKVNLVCNITLIVENSLSYVKNFLVITHNIHHRNKIKYTQTKEDFSIIRGSFRQLLSNISLIFTSVYSDKQRTKSETFKRKSAAIYCGQVFHTRVTDV